MEQCLTRFTQKIVIWFDVLNKQNSSRIEEMTTYCQRFQVVTQSLPAFVQENMRVLVVVLYQTGANC